MLEHAAAPAKMLAKLPNSSCQTADQVTDKHCRWRVPPRLREDGFALIQGLIPASDCRALVEEVDIVSSSKANPLMTRTGNELHPLRWDSHLVAAVIGSSARLDKIRLACDATDLRFISAYVSLKRANSPAMGWHQDWWCWDHPISHQSRAAHIAVICYLGGADRHTGALRVLPGSHLRPAHLHNRIPEAHSAEARALAPDHPAMLAVNGEQAIEVEPGDAVLLDYRVLHGTYPNASVERRDAVLMSFAPDWSSLPADVRDHLEQQPALPFPSERSTMSEAERALFPPSSGAGRSLPVNRTPTFDKED